jgi:hypothetical protein
MRARCLQAQRRTELLPRLLLQQPGHLPQHATDVGPRPAVSDPLRRRLLSRVRTFHQHDEHFDHQGRERVLHDCGRQGLGRAKLRAVSSGSAPPLGAAPDRRHRWQNARARSGWIPGVKAEFEFELRSSFGKRPWRELRILARCVAGPRSPKSEAEVGWQICPSDRRLATRFSSTEAEGCFYCLPIWQRGGTSSESSSIRDHWSDRSVACSVQCV